MTREDFLKGVRFFIPGFTMVFHYEKDERKVGNISVLTGMILYDDDSYVCSVLLVTRDGITLFHPLFGKKEIAFTDLSRREAK